MDSLIPHSTYRLQFNRGFTLKRAAGILEYLRDLGISHGYASPLFAARSGSAHGYDVVDFGRLNPEIGSPEEFEAFTDRLRNLGMGLLLDVVPNHMCVSDSANRWWADVLENGPGSPFAPYFDIDWRPPKIDLADKVLLPFLGDQYGRVLEKEEIRIRFEDGAFVATVNSFALPVAPKAWRLILQPALRAVREARGASDPSLLELESILTALAHLPGRTEVDAERVRERRREREIIRKRLAVLWKSDDAARAALETSLAELNGRKGDPSSFDRLEALLDDEAYRLSYWRVAAEEINYRRFFDINELAAIRVEEPFVFAAVHELVFRWAAEGRIDGLRIDHVDGLYDPLAYLRNLREGWRVARRNAPEPATDPYVVVEKILGRDERLPAGWPADGTTGYDFLNDVTGVFVDASSAGDFRDLYARWIGRPVDVHEQLATCKKLIMHVSMAAELYLLAGRLDRVSEQHRGSRDFTLESLRFALREAVAWFPVYRTYVRGDGARIGADDRRRVRQAIQEAKRHNPATSESLFDFVGDVWLLDHPPNLSESHRQERVNFVLRLQQFTGPVMAKGLEDTFFYRHYPLASLNEVGGDPDAFGHSVKEFHRRLADRRRACPRSLSATATHDTKRGEDTRARLNALSEIPRDWGRALDRWREMNRALHTETEGRGAPDANEEYLVYQTLAGSWPLKTTGASWLPAYAERIDQYLVKALREAKARTSWFNPNLRHEQGVRRFVRSLLDPAAGAKFQADFRGFLRPVIRAGLLTSLSQTLLKIAAPGVPDIYQGTELWDFSLVDPDNRRPVDFDHRKALLASIDRESPRGLMGRLLRSPEDGRVKLHLIRSALRFRAGRSDLFDRGDYRPIASRGPASDHAIAFGRQGADGFAVAAAGRFFLKLAERSFPPAPEAWSETFLELPAGRDGEYRSVLTGTVVRTRSRQSRPTLDLTGIFDEAPVALLERVENRPLRGRRRHA